MFWQASVIRMKFLLDTNALLWAMLAPGRLSSVRNLLIGKNDIYVSIVSWWEIAIKIGIGKLDADYYILYRFALDSGILMLPLEASTIKHILSLPAHHKDPFDRMIIAQAISDSMQIITGDKIFTKYTDLAILV